MEKEYGPAHTTQQERFGGFALAHFGLSGLGFSLVWLGLPAMVLGSAELSIGALIFLVGAALLAYFPMGMFAAWLGGWTSPFTDEERWRAVVYPTAAAWAWVGFVVIAWGTADEALLLLAFIVSITLAFPSSGFVIITMALWENDYSNLESLALVGLLAGVLPPLLFAWGSFCQARWAEKRALKNRPAALPGV